MKKLLLSMLCVAGMATAFAGKSTLVINQCVSDASTTHEFTTFTSGDYTFTADKAEGKTAPAYNKGGDIRLYAANTLTVSCSKGEMTKIVFYLSAQGLKQHGTVTPSAGEVSGQAAGATEVTWTGAAESVTFTIGATNDFGTATDKTSAQFDFEKVVITGAGEAGAPVVEEVAEYASLAAWEAAASESKARITVPVTAVYQNGTDLYITDGTTSMLVYGTLGQSYKNGDVIPAGIEGSYKDYNGQPEFIPVVSTFAAATGNNPVSPKVVEINEISLDMLCQYIRLEGVDFVADASNDRQFYAKYEGEEVPVWNRWKLADLPTGTDATVYAIVGINQGAPSLYPTRVEVEGEPIDPEPGPTPEPQDGIVFDYTQPATLNPVMAAPAENEFTDITDVTFTCGDVTMTTGTGTNTGSAKPRIYNSKGNLTFRVYGDNVTTFVSNAGAIEKIELDAQYNMPGAFTVTTGTVSEDGKTWTGSANTVEFTWHKYDSNGSQYNPQVKSFTVTLSGAAIDAIEAEVADAPAEYFTLQGVRVAEPKGIVIERRGAVVRKVVR